MAEKETSVSQAGHASKLGQICIYPVKSIQGLSLAAAEVEQAGLRFDRRLMVVDAEGQMITARSHPQLLRVSACLLPDGLLLSYPGQPDLNLNYHEFSHDTAEAQVWKDRFAARLTVDAASRWFSQLLGFAARLLFIDQQPRRFRAKLGKAVSFADGYPLLLISQASLDALNQRSPVRHSMAQFRPNLVVEGCEPFAEDSWKRIRIGEVEFEVAKPCSRCVLTTADPNSGKFAEHGEPLHTLRQFRQDEKGELFFGQNLIALNQGRITCGADVEVLAYQTPPIYPERPRQPSPARPLKAGQFTIQIDDEQFIGNAEQPLLQQAEAAGVKLQSRCRAGHCGACRVTLIEGEVMQPDRPALSEQARANGKVLACCCVPQSDLRISRQR